MDVRRLNQSHTKEKNEKEHVVWFGCGSVLFEGDRGASAVRAKVSK